MLHTHPGHSLKRGVEGGLQRGVLREVAQLNAYVFFIVSRAVRSDHDASGLLDEVGAGRLSRS